MQNDMSTRVHEYTSTRVHEYTSTRVHEYTSQPEFREEHEVKRNTVKPDNGAQIYKIKVFLCNTFL